MAKTVIETGVDKLVRLIEEKKSIAVDEAAKKLGVSPVVIEEWADFLEEEGLISIEYKLAKTFLVEHKLNKKEIARKATEFHASKEGFVRKIESSISKLDKDTQGLNSLKTEFGNLKKEIGGEIELVKDELRKLEDYENFKRDVDKRVAKQENEFKGKMEELDQMILIEQKKYDDILSKIKLEEERIKEEEKELDSLKDYEDKLKKRITEFVSQIEGVKELIKQENEKVEVSEKHVKQLEKFAGMVEQTINNKKQALVPLIEESKKHKQKIREMKREVLDKIAEKQDQIQVKVGNYNQVIGKFKKLFDKKTEIETLIKDIETERDAMKAELGDLGKKAVAFDLISKDSNVKQHIKDLEKRFNEVDRRKSLLKSKLLKLMGIVSGGG